MAKFLYMNNYDTKEVIEYLKKHELGILAISQEGGFRKLLSDPIYQEEYTKIYFGKHQSKEKKFTDDLKRMAKMGYRYEWKIQYDYYLFSKGTTDKTVKQILQDLVVLGMSFLLVTLVRYHDIKEEDILLNMTSTSHKIVGWFDDAPVYARKQKINSTITVYHVSTLA